MIATRDRRRELLHTLQRLRALPERPPIIVVDNGSSDGTPDVVRRLAKNAENAKDGGNGNDDDTDHTQVGGDLTVVELGENRGSRARDVGVEAAATPYVAFADDDSWWAPGSLAAAAQLFATHPSVAVLAARILVGHAQTLEPVCREMAASPLPVTDGLPGPRVLGFVACGAVVRRDAFLAAGGFDEILFFRCDESLVAMDLAGAGWDLVYVDELVAHHHPPPSGDPEGQRAVVLRNDLLTAWMRRPFGVVVDATLDLARQARRDPSARMAIRQAASRLPAALVRRRVVPPEVERDLRTLSSAAGSPPR